MPRPVRTAARKRLLMTGLAIAALPLLLAAVRPAGQPGAGGVWRAGDPPTARTETCTDGGCHADIMSHKVMHGPVAQGKCLDCHEYVAPELHLFRFTGPERELCAGCHTLELKNVVHTPVAEQNCSGCHDPHGSPHTMMLHAPASPQLCFTCHDQSMFDKAFVHGPVAIGGCNLCHDPHSTSHARLLTQSAGRLCVDCHSEVEPVGLAARNLHKPLQDGCTTCHDPHASEIKYHLHQSTPTLCYSCHEGVKNEIASASVHHGPVDAEGGCVSCHTPHFSHLPALQRATQPDTCLSCHNQTIRSSDGRTLSNMAAVLRDNPSHHGPIRGNGGGASCTSCHQPHAGERFAMLHEEYPPQFYASFDAERYQLCFSCHLPELVTDPSGTGLTRFRDGDTNLHWLHVNKEKGRTCRACHEVHASSRPFHIRESVPFGTSGWMLEINFEASDEGGSCAPGCHKEATYSRTATATAGSIGTVISSNPAADETNRTALDGPSQGEQR
jgi:predicted CXXCH cytochrome family protein